MRKIAVMLAAALCMTTVMPVYADMTSADKDQCLLVSKDCANTVNDIQTQIRRLSAEIQKGNAVYTPAELAKLQGKLNEAKAVLDDLLRGE